MNARGTRPDSGMSVTQAYTRILCPLVSLVLGTSELTLALPFEFHPRSGGNTNIREKSLWIIATILRGGRERERRG